MIKKIISGGQTGADQAGLFVAKWIGIETGGWMPKGFLTQEGNRPEFAEKFGMQEHNSAKYPPRTRLNVASSDGTIRIAKNFKSSGEICTLRAISEFDKPYFDYCVDDPWDIDEAVKWIKDNNISILNVAGNSERSCPGIFDLASVYLKTLLFAIGHEKTTSV